jgi:hypothetical protein
LQFSLQAASSETFGYTLFSSLLDDRGSFPVWSSNGISFFFFSHHRVQTGSGAHPTFYPVDNGNSYPGDKAAGDVHSPPCSAEFTNAWSYTTIIHTPSWLGI